MQHRAASSRRSVAFGIVFAVALMVLSFLAVLSATKVQAQSSQCAGADNVATFTGTQNQTTETFRIRGDSFRLTFDIQGSGSLDVAVVDEDGGTVEERVTSSGDGSEIIDLGPGTFRLEIRERGNVSSYDIDVDDCLGDGVNTAQINTAQNPTDTTTADTTTADTASPAAEDTTLQEAANPNPNTNVNRDGSFRCELFLRTVRDDRGALKAQYKGDQLIVQRFEQCLSGNVLADTIPNRNLPFTGGMSLLALAAIGLASLVAGAAVLRAVMRRGG
jgi:hypothetical protein